MVEPVPLAVHRANVLCIARRLAELTAQVVDLGIDGAVETLKVVAVDGVNNLITGEDAPGLAQERHEDAELGAR